MNRAEKHAQTEYVIEQNKLSHGKSVPAGSSTPASDLRDLLADRKRDLIARRNS